MVINIDGAQSILLLFYFLSSSSESVWAPPSLRSRRRGSSVLHPTALSAAAFSRPFDQNMGIPDSEVFLIFLFIYLFLARRNSEASESPSPVAPAVVMFVKASRWWRLQVLSHFLPWKAEIVSAQKMWHRARKKITGGLTPHCSSAFDSSDTSPLIQVLNYSFTACGWFETAVIAGEEETRWLELTSMVAGTTCFSSTQCSEEFVHRFLSLNFSFFLMSHWVSHLSYSSDGI